MRGCLLVVVACAASFAQTIDVGRDLQLFLDDRVVESQERVQTVLHSPRPAEVVIRLDRPYEDDTLYDPTVIKDGDRYRMWYRANFNGPPSYTGYAESADGVRWTKPNLGIIPIGGSAANNVVWGGPGSTISVFKDANPATRAGELYKGTALVNRLPNGRAGLYGMVSPDGLHWRLLQPDPILVAPADDPMLDSHNIVLWDSARRHYAIYARGWKRHKVRDVRRFTSTDFRHWTEPKFLDFADAPVEHLYKNAAIPYYRRPDLILLFPKRYVPDRRHASVNWPLDGISDVVFAFSYDGLRFDRRYMEAFLRPGMDEHNWHERAIEAGPALVPTGPGEMSLYYVEHYRTPGVQIRRGVLREDGFVSLKAPYRGGIVRTKPIRFAGSRLVLNYSTSAAGSIRIAIEDAAGQPIRGFGAEECPEIFGDDVNHTVRWKTGPDVSSLAGKPVRLRFEMRDADLYSFRFD
ncbi:MAG: hypothetical protein ACKV22_09250 [Bryobacteraceae bacterium]